LARQRSFVPILLGLFLATSAPRVQAANDLARLATESDLQVVTIARSPAFPRYLPIYTSYSLSEPSGFGPYVFSAATGLGGGQTGSTPRWPGLGSTVTYTATVRNRGDVVWDTSIAGT